MSTQVGLKRYLNLEKNEGQTSVFRVKPIGGLGPKCFKDLTDGASNTLALVDLPFRSVIWTSDIGVSNDEIFQAIKESNPENPVLGVCYDTSIHRLSSEMTREQFDALVTHNAGDDTGFFWR